MRKVVWSLACAAAVAGIALHFTVLHAAAPARIFVTFVSHNEESTSNPPCAPVLTDRARYLANRAAVVSLASDIVDRGATWDFQSEWEYLTKVAAWDDPAARASTDGVNIIKYLSGLAPDRLVVDAHSHELRGYNYADVSYLLAQLGVESTGVVGGFIYTPSSRANWTRFRAPVAGSKYRTATFDALTLWGGGSADHRNDSTASGIWRPKSATEFHTDDPAQRLTNIGHYTGDVLSADGALDLVARLRRGELQPGHMYTATIMIPQCEIDSNPETVPAVLGIIASLSDAVRNREVVWATMPDMIRIWRDEYGSVPTVFQP